MSLLGCLGRTNWGMRCSWWVFISIDKTTTILGGYVHNMHCTYIWWNGLGHSDMTNGQFVLHFLLSPHRCWQISKTCHKPWALQRWPRSWVCPVWKDASGTFRWDSPKVGNINKDMFASFFWGFDCFCGQATCATTGEGLIEGLEWLSGQLKNVK